MAIPIGAPAMHTAIIDTRTQVKVVITTTRAAIHSQRHECCLRCVFRRREIGLLFSCHTREMLLHLCEFLKNVMAERECILGVF